MEFRASLENYATFAAGNAEGTRGRNERGDRKGAKGIAG